MINTPLLSHSTNGLKFTIFFDLFQWTYESWRIFQYKFFLTQVILIFLYRHRVPDKIILCLFLGEIRLLIWLANVETRLALEENLDYTLIHASFLIITA